MYSMTEVAEMLGRPKSTVRKWMSKGALATVEIDGLKYVPIAALKAHGLVWESIQLADRLNARRAAA